MSFLPFVLLIERARNGDQEACAKLVRDYGRTVRRMARIYVRAGRLQSQAEPSDLVQSVWRTFFGRLAAGEYQLATAEQLLALLRRIVRYRAVNLVHRLFAQKRGGRVRIGSLSLIPQESDPQSAGASPCEHVMAMEERAWVRSQVTDEEWQLLIVRAEGADWPAIGARYGRTPNAMRMRHDRILARIREKANLHGSSRRVGEF